MQKETSSGPQPASSSESGQRREKPHDSIGVLSFTSSAGRPPLVGRDAERRRLDRTLEGRGGLVLLSGEPGVGKTRLASEVLEDGR